MTTEQYDRLIVLEDYLKRYMSRELQSFKVNPPKNDAEREELKLYSTFFEFINLNDIWGSSLTMMLNSLKSDLHHAEHRSKVLKKLCTVHGISTQTAFYKETDF